MAAYAGTLATIRTAVVDRLKLDVTVDTDRVDEWINLAYAQAVQDTGCLQGCGSVALTPDEDGYLFPDEVQWVKALHFVYDDGTLSIPLELVSLEEILNLRRHDTAVGEQVMCPKYAMLGQNRFELWPEPGDDTVLKFWYVYLPDQLLLDADVPVIKEPYGSKLLEIGACVEGAKFKKDPLIQSYQQEYTEWLRRFQGWLNRRRTGTGTAMRVVTGNERPDLSLIRESEAI